MNIAFLLGNAVQPTKGGISRITHTLGQLFESKQDEVYYISLTPFEGVPLKNQLFVDNSTLEDSIGRIVAENKIGIIINQFRFNKSVVDAIYQCKQQNKNLKIVSCYHNSILTPIYNIAYQREVPLKQKHLGLLFDVLKLKVVNKAIVNYYIHKHRKDYLNVYQKSDAVVVLCEGQQEELQRMLGINDSDKIHVIYNTYTPENNTAKPKKKRVIWVGTFDIMVKRPDIMVKAWAKLFANYSDWELYMLGDGPALEPMKRLAYKLQLKNINFTGRVHPDAYYEEASIHCITSTHECFPMVILEAKANRCATIATNCFTSAPLLVKNNANGLLIKPFSPEALAVALSTLMGEPSKLKDMQNAAYEDLKRFDSDNIYEQWNKLFQEIC